MNNVADDIQRSDYWDYATTQVGDNKGTTSGTSTKLIGYDHQAEKVAMKVLREEVEDEGRPVISELILNEWSYDNLIQNQNKTVTHQPLNEVHKGVTDSAGFDDCNEGESEATLSCNYSGSHIGLGKGVSVIKSNVRGLIKFSDSYGLGQEGPRSQPAVKTSPQRKKGAGGSPGLGSRKLVRVGGLQGERGGSGHASVTRRCSRVWRSDGGSSRQEVTGAEGRRWDLAVITESTQARPWVGEELTLEIGNLNGEVQSPVEGEEAFDRSAGGDPRMLGHVDGGDDDRGCRSVMVVDRAREGAVDAIVFDKTTNEPEEDTTFGLHGDKTAAAANEINGFGFIEDNNLTDQNASKRAGDRHNQPGEEGYANSDEG
ncbi:hypothetical protein HN873_025603, partial [Arachis hypogaea]